MLIQQHISLQPYNTFGISAEAAAFCIIRTKEDVISLIQNELKSYAYSLVIGGGSNILLCNNVEGLVIKNEIKGIEIIEENDTEVWVKSYSVS